ncbi:hypothetical protein FB566_4121 [Stackebrandtia endophytica]|uniref:Peptidase M23-like protein n=1 Tax=Stackebrandtia endophytica TaxID=1496996 RepID=A0A543B122_9ACTN|nr:peptidase M23 [Stackebrandtia endophytica]TQL78532.1 hypothetical protein FB566_4121 [Stackebrandtia endophytica]
MPTPHQQDGAEIDGPDTTDDDTRTTSRFAWLGHLSVNRSTLRRGAAALGVVAVVTVGMWAAQGQPPVGDIGDTAAVERGDEHADRSTVREQVEEPDVEESETADPVEEPTEEPEPAEPPRPVGGLDEVQMANAVTVVEIGKELGFSERGQAVALVTAMQESLMRNVASDAVPESLQYPHEGIMIDYDSVGLFQQRPSMGWGTIEQCMDVEYSTTTFYNALAQVDGWENMDLTVAAQAVQKSAFPDRYAQWEGMAWDVIAEVNG